MYPTPGSSQRVFIAFRSPIRAANNRGSHLYGAPNPQQRLGFDPDHVGRKRTVQGDARMQESPGFRDPDPDPDLDPAWQRRARASKGLLRNFRSSKSRSRKPERRPCKGKVPLHETVQKLKRPVVTSSSSLLSDQFTAETKQPAVFTPRTGNTRG